MGFSKKHQDGESLAGITMRAPLKSLSTRRVKEDDENLNSGETTPTSKGSRIPEPAACPPPPRKRRPVSTCLNHANREFFTSPELDNLFKVL
ncbi:cyclin-dependent protein kinase inhibitor SMR6-like [Bidens hawaiensis]|uniref:cyclin-dependent protein kinase inhibitor SMR6-like n=1 Tax=Bidens hawaiensis TaxID=980011 RepID=UPI00404AED4C